MFNCAKNIIVWGLLFLVSFSTQVAEAADGSIAVADITTTSLPSEVHCPANTQISAYAIPHSLHSIYSAEVFGVKFSGFDLTGLPLEDMPLIQSFIAENADQWSLTCIYGRDGLHITLMSEAYADLIQCRFPDGSYQCLGDIDICHLTCRSNAPTAPTNFSADAF